MYSHLLANQGSSLLLTMRPSFYDRTLMTLIEVPEFPVAIWRSTFLSKKAPSAPSFFNMKLFPYIECSSSYHTLS